MSQERTPDHYAVEGYYLKRGTKEREWLTWVDNLPTLGMARRQLAVAKDYALDKEDGGFSAARIVAIYKEVVE